MPRYPELDILRTLAVLMMIVFHLGYDLSEFYGWNIRPFEGGWLLLQVSTASLFLLLVGAGFAISWNRHPAKRDLRIATTKYLKRGLGLIAIGMLVSIVTYVINPDTYVRFGILHLIGAGILLLPFLARLREWNALLGIIIIMGAAACRAPTCMILNTSLFLPFGFHPVDFSSVDYFPLIPWFGLMLMGYAAGYFLYVRVTFRRPHYSNLQSPFSILAWPGRHALVIYLVHQPVLLTILWLISASQTLLR